MPFCAKRRAAATEHTGVARPYRACRSRSGLHELLDLTAHKALLLDPCSPLIAWRLMLKPETRRLIEVARSVEPREGPEEDSAVLAFIAERQSGLEQLPSDALAAQAV